MPRIRLTRLGVRGWKAAARGQENEMPWIRRLRRLFHMEDSTSIPAKKCGIPSLPNAAAGANGNLGNNSTSLNKMAVNCPEDVPPPSRLCRLPPAIGDNSASGNDSVSLAETVVHSSTALASLEGSSLQPGANGNLGNNSRSLNKMAVNCSEDVPPPSRVCRLPPGDSSASGNGSV